VLAWQVSGNVRATHKGRAAFRLRSVMALEMGRLRGREAQAERLRVRRVREPAKEKACCEFTVRRYRVTWVPRRQELVHHIPQDQSSTPGHPVIGSTPFEDLERGVFMDEELMVTSVGLAARSARALRYGSDEDSS